MRSLEQIKTMPVGLRQELSVYYLPTSVWARDRLVALGIKALGAVQEKPDCIEFMVDGEQESVRMYMADIGLPMADSTKSTKVPRATLESILARLKAIENELEEALR